MAMNTKSDAENQESILTKPVIGWALCDLADTAFSALFVTFFFSVLLTEHLGGNDFQFGLTISIAMLFAAILVPTVGAWSDTIGVRKPFLRFFTTCCVILTAIVPFTTLPWTLFLAGLAVLCYQISLDVYDALLRRVSNSRTIGRVSGLGVAFGYCGSILSLGMAYMILSYYGWETIEGVRAVMLATALFYLAFSQFLFIWVKEPTGTPAPILKSVKDAFSSIGHSLSHIGENKTVWSFLLASLLYTGGMNTAIAFLYRFGKEKLGIGVQAFFPVFALMAVGAGCGALIAGKLSQNVGARKTILIMITGWIGVLVMLMTYTTHITYLLGGILGGAALGGVWTVTRQMLITLAPQAKLAQFLGFQGLTEKSSGIIGPGLFGFLAVKAGYTIAMVPILIFFVIGFLIVWRLPERN